MVCFQSASSFKLSLKQHLPSARRLKLDVTCTAHQTRQENVAAKPSHALLQAHVSQAVRDYHQSANASTQRGTCTYELGRLATDTLAESRDSVRRTMGLREDDEIIFAHDSVHAMHTLATSICRSLSSDEMIVLSPFCHTHVLHIWQTTADAYNIVTTLVEPTPGEQPDIPDFAQCLTSPTGQQRMRVVVTPLFCPASLDVTPVDSFVPFLKGVAALSVLDATTPILNDCDNDMGEQGIQQHVLHAIETTRRRCVPDVIVTDIIISDSGPSPAVMMASKSLWKTLPPAIDGERSLTECSLDSTSRAFGRRRRSKWAPVPNRFECETATAPIAVAAAAALSYCVDDAECD